MGKKSLRPALSPSTGNSKQMRHSPDSVKADSKRSSGNKRFSYLTRHDETMGLFPRFTPLLIFLVTLVIRVLYVLNPRNWWMVHPDEVYQSVEVAHIEAFGYGFRTYDFSPPESSSDDISRYRQMEINAGMFALRSPVFPYFYVVVWRLSSLAGLQVNPYLLWRVAHVIVSSLLPLAVHRCVVKLYGSPDKGCISAIFVAASTHLNVLGTHCLLHSFLAPFTFLALSMLAELSACDSTLLAVSHDSGSFVTQMSPARNTSNLEISPQDEKNNNKTNSMNATTHKTNKRTRKESNTVKLKSPNGVDSHCNGQDNKEETNTTNSNWNQNMTTDSSTTPKYLETATGAFIATLTCYVRPDGLLIYMIHFVSFPKLRQFLVSKTLISFLLGASGALAIGIGTDFCYYGWGVYSCLNWLNFNIISGFSYRIFGEMSWWFYIEKLCLHNYGVTTLLLFVVFVFSVQILKTRNEEKSTEHICREESVNKTQTVTHTPGLSSCVVWVLLFSIYSLNKHKETRFIHDAITFMFIFIADVLVNLKLYYQSGTKCNNFIRLILVVFTVTQYQSFPASSKNLDWIYQRTEFVNDVNECIKYISTQPNVTGVFYDSNIYMTGGMSLLHHNVPILSLVENGFYEFGPRSRRNYTKKSPTSTNNASQEIGDADFEYSVNEFNRASNYIAVANAPAALRVIIRNPAYNYLVLRQNRKFVDFGFKEVYAVGSSRVLRRLLDVDSEYMLDTLLDSISAGSNATILLHEGDVLFHMNQYLEASERFYQAVTLDEQLRDAYLPLQICYSKLGNERAARSVYGKCVSLFDQVACTTPRKITRI